MIHLILVTCLFSPLVLCGPVVETPYGEVEGLKHATSDGKEVDVFLGIRYGRAPDHIFRFEKPEPVEKWAPLRHQATKFRAACIPFHRSALERENYSEDCLFLNIVTPNVKPTAPLPVLVFIHGGGFEIGDAETYGYKMAADNFASKGIIFVSLQYRLGPLGFFTTGDNVVPGNMGLWDQTLALQFLHEVLPSFGGDPDRITLSGHSAGSSSVSGLLYSPHSDHLFNQAIEMSGSVFAEYSMSEAVVEESRALADAVGCKMTDSIKLHECMKERTMDEILDGVVEIESTRRHPNFIKFHPRFDKDFFPYEVEKMAKKAPKKKTMQGVTSLESGIFGLVDTLDYLAGKIVIPEARWGNFSSEDVIDFITSSVATEHEYGRKMGPFLDLLDNFYLKRDLPSPPTSSFYIQRYIELLSDLQFFIPTFHEIDMKRLNGWETYYYVIDYVSEATRDKTHPVDGAYHGSELRFLLEFMGLEKLELSKEDRAFKKHLLSGYVNFIKTGNPSSAGLEWKPVSAEHPSAHMRLNENAKMMNEFRQEVIDFWLTTVPDVIGTDILKKGRLPAAQAHVRHTEL